MGKRKIIIKQSVADNIAKVAFFIESKGLQSTAEKFADDVYDFFDAMSDDRRRFSLCTNKRRAIMGYKCYPYKKKYTIVFVESDEELIFCEFVPSRLIK